MSTLTSKTNKTPREPESSGSGEAADSHGPSAGKPAPGRGGFSAAQLAAAFPGALRKLDPRIMWHTPVMFIVEVGAALITVIAVAESVTGSACTSGGSAVPGSFTWLIAAWLWLTVIFANLAEAVAEGRGKAQAASLRATRTTTPRSG
ncbi:hypothetical protein [Arthrobacter sp. ATA002]|uniref:hypothetical protein n=1 Tax=Arthrobacter sp. ATA002 TaxID=2991715 RepID=UPI003FA487A2